MPNAVGVEKMDVSASDHQASDARSETSRSGKSGVGASNSSITDHSRHSRHGKRKPTWPSPDKYNRRSLLLFTLESPVRKFFIAAIEWPWWDRTVLVVIMMNTLILLMQDPYDIPEFLYESRVRSATDTLSTVCVYLLQC
jgi:hypothetical protein